MNPEVIHAAREAFAKELFEKQVQAEVERLRRNYEQSLWRRFLATLPFTITITWRKP